MGIAQIVGQILMMSSLTGAIARATFLLLMGWAAVQLLRKGPAALRHLAWLSTLIGVVLLPALGEFGRIPIPVLPEVARGAIVIPVAGISLPIGAGVAATRSAVVESGAATEAPQPTARDSRSVVSGIWATGAALGVAWLVAGWLVIAHLLGASRLVESDEWLEALVDACTRLGIAKPPRLVESARVDIPFTCNVLSPTIVLPPSAREWTPERRHTVLLHEVAHVRRRDLIGHTVASLACAVYWFHPLVWLASLRLRVECELACDDLVLGAGVRASDYAQHLVDLVAMLTGRERAPSGALAIAHRREFERRVLAILDAGRSRTTAGWSRGVVTVGGIGLLAAATAAMTPVPRASRKALPALGDTLYYVVDAAAAWRPSPLNAAPTLGLASVSDTRAPAPAATVRTGNDTTRAKGAEYVKVIVPEGTVTAAGTNDSTDANDAAWVKIITGPQKTIVVPQGFLSALHRGRTAPGVKATATTFKYMLSTEVVDPFSALLRISDSLRLTAVQMDSIAKLNRDYTVGADSIITPTAKYLAALPDSVNDEDAYARYRGARDATIDLLVALDQRANAVLTADQRQGLPALVTQWLDPSYARSLRSGPASPP